jgi:hypothetical protein
MESRSNLPPLDVRHIYLLPCGGQVKHIRGIDNQPFACVGAYKVDGMYYVGIALKHPKDNYSKKVGRDKALGRARQLIKNRIPTFYTRVTTETHWVGFLKDLRVSEATYPNGLMTAFRYWLTVP